MEDIRPYHEEDEERDDTSENPAEWELAGLDSEEEVPFHVPRD